MVLTKTILFPLLLTLTTAGAQSTSSPFNPANPPASTTAAGIKTNTNDATSAASSTSLTSLLLFNLTSAPYLASIISANPTAATLSLACASPSACPLGSSGATITAAGASYDYLALDNAGMTDSIHCALTGAPGSQATTGTCLTSEGGRGSSGMVANATVGSADLSYYPVTITGGFEYLAAASSEAAAASTSSMPGPTSSGARGGNGASAGATGSNTGSAATASPTSEGAVSRMGVGAVVVAVAGLLGVFVL